MTLQTTQDENIIQDVMERLTWVPTNNLSANEVQRATLALVLGIIVGNLRRQSSEHWEVKLLQFPKGDMWLSHPVANDNVPINVYRMYVCRHGWTPIHFGALWLMDMIICHKTNTVFVKVPKEHKGETT